MNYADLTINDKNRLKRWIQKRRLLDALSVLDNEAAPNRKSLKILDYGAGNGELCKLLAEKFDSFDIVSYEPAPVLFKEAQLNLKDFPAIKCISDLGDIKNTRFDYIFCLEVFEHLPKTSTIIALENIKQLLAKEGTAIIGVPHEIHMPALLKGLFRMMRRFGQYDAQLSNIIKCVIGFPPKDRPVSTIADTDLSYYFEHLGFDYRQFKKIIIDELGFHCLEMFFSPFKILRSVLNSEVYFVLKK